MLKKILLSLMVTLLGLSAKGEPTTSISSPPKLVVNIVVGAMRAGDIERYRSTLGSGGFVRLADRGVNFTDANYNFHQTTTPVSLATLSTGALPSSHGVISRSWWEYILGDKVELIVDKGVRNLEYNLRDHGYSAHRLTSPTLSDMLLRANPKSQSVSIAIEPESAIVMNGRLGVPYWIDPLTCEWGSSTAFMDELPAWVTTYNKSPKIGEILRQRWISMLPKTLYKNQRSTILESKSTSRKLEAPALRSSKSREEQRKIQYEQLAYTPAGNSAIFDYACRLIDTMKLGRDENPDILNIYLDPSRNIAQRYGAQSIEVEDMFMNLDRDIERFLSHLNDHIHSGDMVVVLTSDHGISPSFGDDAEPMGRFNSAQFMVLVNSFLRARYGDDRWVLGYIDRNLYLNHQLIYKHGISTADVQNEVASFALQFRGVAHALTSSAMRNGYFGSGYGHKMQNSFYPRRSGDVVLNFMAGWIEQSEGIRADAGSTYRYDTHVPLIIYAEGYMLNSSVGREVAMEDLAPTLSFLLQIDSPTAADGKAIEEFVE